MLNLYDNKYRLEFHDSAHRYLVNGEVKPGVTSILQLLNKPGIPQWAANQAIKSIQDHSQSFPEHLNSKAWIVTEWDLKRAKSAYLRSRDDSADLGKRVHAWVEHHIKSQIEGKNDDEKFSDDMRPSIKSFLEWEEEIQPTYLFSERVIYSEGGDFCGTCDVGIMLKDASGVEKRMILDFKTGKPESQFDTKTKRYTGKKRPYSTVFIQDALYDKAIEEEDGIKADMYGALYLSTNGDLLFGLTNHTAAYRDAGDALVSTFHALKKIDILNTWM